MNSATKVLPLHLPRIMRASYSSLDNKPTPGRLFSEQDVPFEEEFTERELEILQLMAEGYKAEMIAQTLFISPHTVKTHQKNMLKKSGCANSIHVVAVSIRMGII